MFRPLAMLSVVGLLALGTNLRAADEQPKDVILKAIKAHGGEEALTKYKAGTAKGKGKINIPGIGEIDFTQETAHMLPDKFKEAVELKVAGQTINTLTLVDGDKCVIEANGKAVPVDDTTKDALKDLGYKLKMGKLVALVKEKGFELNLIGEEKVEDKPAIGIRVTSNGKKDVNLYFDKKTNLLVKIESRTIDPITKNEINEERIIAEYQKNKDQIPVPKKIVVKHDGKTFLEIELSEVELLEKIDESEFRK